MRSIPIKENMRREITGALTFVLIVTGLVVESQVAALETVVETAAYDVAKKDLQGIRELIVAIDKELGPRGIQSLQIYGIKSVKEVETLGVKLGDPMTVYRVNFGQLKQYQPTTSLDKLLGDISNRIIFPVKVGEEVRSSIIVTRSKDGEWKATERGWANLTKLLTSYRKTKFDTAIWIPEMNLYFIGTNKAGQLDLIPLGNLPRIQLTAGESIPANQLFARLQPEAKAHKGGLR